MRQDLSVSCSRIEEHPHPLPLSLCAQFEPLSCASLSSPPLLLLLYTSAAPTNGRRARCLSVRPWCAQTKLALSLSCSLPKQTSKTRTSWILRFGETRPDSYRKEYRYLFKQISKHIRLVAVFTVGDGAFPA